MNKNGSTRKCVETRSIEPNISKNHHIFMDTVFVIVIVFGLAITTAVNILAFLDKDNLTDFIIMEIFIILVIGLRGLLYLRQQH